MTAEEPTAASRPVVVVGHDGSAFADHALRWALGLAGRLDAPVTVVRVWSITTSAPVNDEQRGYVPPFSAYAEATRLALLEDTAAVRAEHPDVAVDCKVAHGAPVRELLAFAEDAELLVVGPRGLGGFLGLVLGSVTDQCVRHAPCPVVVVRTPDDDEVQDGPPVLGER